MTLTWGATPTNIRGWSAPRNVSSPSGPCHRLDDPDSFASRAWQLSHTYINPKARPVVTLLVPPKQRMRQTGVPKRGSSLALIQSGNVGTWRKSGLIAYGPNLEMVRSPNWTLGLFQLLSLPNQCIKLLVGNPMKTRDSTSNASHFRIHRFTLLKFRTHIKYLHSKTHCNEDRLWTSSHSSDS